MRWGVGAGGGGFVAGCVSSRRPKGLWPSSRAPNRAPLVFTEATRDHLGTVPNDARETWPGGAYFDKRSARMGPDAFLRGERTVGGLGGIVPAGAGAIRAP